MFKKNDALSQRTTTPRLTNSQSRTEHSSLFSLGLRTSGANKSEILELSQFSFATTWIAYIGVSQKCNYLGHSSTIQQKTWMRTHKSSNHLRKNTPSSAQEPSAEQKPANVLAANVLLNMWAMAVWTSSGETLSCWCGFHVAFWSQTLVSSLQVQLLRAGVYISNLLLFITQTDDLQSKGQICLWDISCCSEGPSKNKA